ncbi:Alpha/Beta hydrolase protein [Massariosphaeria phaeospora]|uniref:Alpha/Beta hydrolase protein n=1 Tax=Massariosphaeria phaeospora TaxID=100035 RepID=A0A7C8MIL2_9PLEO|nr:Alpha/Beta hydrolase protein [Massariosphaeria phaeospora]
MHTVLLTLPVLLLSSPSLAQTFKPAPGNFPAKGDGDFAGGIFSISLQDLPKYVGDGGTGTETPRGNGQKTSGSGPYPAQMITDPTLPNHTIFAPKTPPTGNLSMPFIAWGNGACTLGAGTYENFLKEIASYGYVIAADGTPNGGSSTSQQSKVQDMRDSLDWATAGKAAKYGNVDVTKTTTAGHSCGGLEAMSTAYHDERVKRIMLFNIAIFQDDRRYLLQEIKVPVAYIIGGKNDMGYPTSAKDYAALNAGLPKFRANLDTGHGGTYPATNGGKFGKAAVAYLEWQWRNNATAKAILLDAQSPGSLVKDNWVVEHANWS